MRVLVTGATGYIGGRLVPDLLEQGYEVRVLVRDQSRIAGRPWAGSVEIAVGDLAESDSLRSALEGVESAYYLVHSMYSGSGYAERDRCAVNKFIQAARNLKHVIYLGGLLPNIDKVSEHLRSRAEVGEILRNELPTTEFRSGPIIGSGSASFEMVRYLTERLPFMVAPHWILNEVQPIAIRDILKYLVLALEHKLQGIVEVGADRLTFKQMMEIYAEVRGLKRVILTVPPILEPKLGALWIGLITPIPNSLAVPLIEGIIHSVVADTERARKLFPEIVPISYKEAVGLALKRIQHDDVETRWSGALGSSLTYALSDREGLISEIRVLNV
ncbi:MAG TPA: NAD(P)H-binding protein, partial [Thermodesulfobacteriota bacterium]|nr:NAD(P)H-binding protein [Thermodesulfobacteriota bacterium]